MINENVDCIFCRLIHRELPISVVYEDEKVICFMDIQPINTGHLLIIPKTHATYLKDLKPDIGGHMFKIAMNMSESLRASGIRCEGVNLFLADGEVAGQEVFHVHLHVIPRFEGDGFGFRFDESYYILPEREELDETARKIGEVIRAQSVITNP
jgi:histidine triad (HIT) family protein